MADKGLYNLLINLQANTAQLQQDMDKAVGILQRSGRTINQVAQGIGQGFGQIVGGRILDSIASLSSALTDLADKGEEAGSIAESFRQIGGAASAIEGARKATLGMVSSFDLMRVANEGLIKGIPRLNESFASLADFASRFANATGRDTLDVLRQMTDAIAKGSNKALREFGITIEETGSKTGNMTAAIEAFRAKMDEMGPATDSVSNSHKAFTTAVSDAITEIGIGINENEKLAEVYRKLEEAIRAIDWVQFGQDFATMVANVTSSIPMLDYLLERLKDIANIAEASAGNTIRSQILQLEEYKSQLNTQLEQTRVTSGTMTGTEWRAEVARLQSELASTQATIDRLLAQGKNEAEFPKGGVGASQNIPPPQSMGLVFRDGQWIEAQRRAQGELEYERRTTVSKNNKELAEEEKRLKEEAEAELDYQRRREMTERLRAEAEARDQVFSFDNFDFSGLKSTWGDVFAQVADAFGSDLSGIMRQIGDQFSEQINYAINSSYNTTTEEAHAQGVQGPGQQNGMFSGGQDYASWFQAAMAVYQNFATVDERDRGAKDNRAWGQTSGAAIGAVIAGAFTYGLAAPLGAAIGGAIGGAIGKLIPRGPQNKDTIERHAFANWMEDKLSEMGGFSVYNQSQGRYSRLNNFIEGSRDRFNKPGWADEFNKNPGASTFSGLGMAFKEMLGLTREVGEQISVLLFDNLDGNVNNARMLMKRLKLSFEEVQEALVEMGRRGEKTWLEVETGIQGASDAFKEGLKEVGDFNLAMQMLIDSGARGFEAIQSVRNIGIEAQEAQIKDFAELREHLLKTWDPKIVDAFFASLEQRGITSIEQLSTLSDRDAGGVVADMQAAGVQFKEVGDKMEKSTAQVDGSIKEATSAIRELSAAIRGQEYKAPQTEEDPEVEMASGGVVMGPKRALMGEAGPEAILPLTRKNGKLGVAFHGMESGGGAVVFNIDARGAAPGVEHQIRRAMREVEGRVMDRMARTNAHRRGRSN